ncbi:DMT family transporter [Dapis sp. BLCC M229]|uniref:DMT family transporter n=1 Tax=Dapis sp. BLCC M229 TaxID=3400188 RepID=UPI003CE78291
MTEQLELPESNFFPVEVKKAYIAILTTLFITAFIPILFRISEGSITSNATIFNRLWIATAILGLWNGLLFLKQRYSGEFATGTLPNSSDIKLFPDTHSLLLSLILAISFVGFQLLWAFSLTQTSVANSEVLHSVTPLFITLVGWSLFGQKFDRPFLIGMAIAITGSITLAANDLSITIEKLSGDGVALLSAVFWAGNLVVMEKLRTQLSIIVITIVQCLLGTLFLLPILWLTGDDLFPHYWGGWLTVIILGITVILNQTLMAYSLKWLSSGLIATILLLNPIVTGILAWVIFSETLNLLNWLSLFIILFGIYLTTLSKQGIKTQ